MIRKKVSSVYVCVYYFFFHLKRRGNKFEEKDAEENQNISNKENVRIKRRDRKIISVGGGQREIDW